MARRSSKIDFRSNVFIDTSAPIALLVPDDSLHVDAGAMFADLRTAEARITTTEMVLAELANGLSAVRYRHAAVSVIDDLIASHSASIVWSNRELFDAAYELYKNRPDKDWSLTDCASFVVMSERGIFDSMLVCDSRIRPG